MRGFIKVAAAVPRVAVADTKINIASITEICQKLDSDGVVVAVFPELCITGYTCGDLFHNNTLLESARAALVDFARKSTDWSLVCIVGLPIAVNNILYNVAAVVQRGKILGLVPKTYIPNYNEFYEKRWWASAPSHPIDVDIAGYGEVPMSVESLFRVNGVTFGIEICEDLWTAVPPSSQAALAGAEIIFNLSASNTVIGKYDYLRNLVLAQSGRCTVGYVYASAGYGESSTDLVFDGITFIAENGNMISQGERWHKGKFYTTADIDIAAIRHDRMSLSSFNDCAIATIKEKYSVTDAFPVKSQGKFARLISPTPFVPTSTVDIASRCEEIINIQTAGLAQRLSATRTRNLVVGVSGGLDSTLALLVAVRTFDTLGLNRKGIHAVTMPGFGTTDRTYNNAVNLIEALETSFREINISQSVTQHFNDIGHDAAVKNVTYENSQARQRTMILMDIANQVGGMVLGTGDLSELALGWATYNGDHMSMYNINAGVPKTLVRYLVEHFAQGTAKLINIPENSAVHTILTDIAATPISPELIPADDKGNIVQKTEDLVGPYILHDFFLYYTIRYGLTPDDILDRACHAFKGKYVHEDILHWLHTFIRRFFSQQFKRSCMPDAPKVGSVCLSPRGDWRMPSDASVSEWLITLHNREK
ncbi:MAG: NAD(+) synthase [Muribaculaceae bacterium]|nr:NAD(+) synthase [Muribaculaceae bacterium]